MSYLAGYATGGYQVDEQSVLTGGLLVGLVYGTVGPNSTITSVLPLFTQSATGTAPSVRTGTIASILPVFTQSSSGAFAAQEVPANLMATVISSSRIDLTWDAITGALGYDVERNGAVIALDVATTSYSDTGLSPDTEYTHRVRTVLS